MVTDDGDAVADGKPLDNRVSSLLHQRPCNGFIIVVLEGWGWVVVDHH